MKRTKETTPAMMTRLLLKTKARRQLAGKYGDALGVAVLTSLAAGALSILIMLLGDTILPAFQLPALEDLTDISSNLPSMDRLLDWFGGYISRISQNLWFLALSGLLISLARGLYRLLVGNVAAVGRERWYVRAAQADVAPPLSVAFSLFRKGQYGKTVLSMLWTSLWLLIWSSLPSLVLLAGLFPQQLVVYHALTGGSALTEGLVIRVSRLYSLPIFFFSPAMVLISLALGLALFIVYIRKSYSYRLVPYLLADNPSLGARQTLRLSKSMTRGSIGRLFMLDLSFLGWVLLCLLCICMPWVTLHLLAPYYFMTWAEAYKMLRDEATGRGLVRMEDLGYVRVS